MGILKEVESVKFELVNYFDVWLIDNEWDVNNLCYEEDMTIWLHDGYTEKDILSQLKEVGFLQKHVRLNMLDIWNDGNMIEIFQRKDGMPLCRLESTSETETILTKVK